jgi:hypothetical protein
VAVIKMDINDYLMQPSHANLLMYQTQTVMVKNLSTVAASRCPVRWIIVYKNIQYDLDCKNEKIQESLQPFDYIHNYICVTHGRQL